jgi:SAM-dependent methyltransferase
MAAAWLRAAEGRNRMMAKATERMFAHAAVREGARVLDVGTGTGDTALMLAHRVGARGEVLATDASPAMVSAAAAAARDAGFANVEARVQDLAAPLDDLGTFDAVVARNVLMFLGDFSGALARIRAVLRPGGRFAAVVWAELERNPFNAIPIEAVRARGKLPVPPPEVVRAFSLSDPAALARAFEGAVFTNVVVERVPATRETGSLAETMKIFDDVPLYRELASRLSAEERREALAEIERAYGAFAGAGGACVFPVESLVVGGSAA